MGGTRSFRLRALSPAGVWTAWSPWLEVDAGPGKVMDLEVFPDVPLLFNQVVLCHRTGRQYCVLLPEIFPGTPHHDYVPIVPLAALQLPSTTTLEEVAAAASSVEEVMGDIVFEQSGVDGAGVDAVRVPGKAPGVSDCGFLIKQGIILWMVGSPANSGVLRHASLVETWHLRVIRLGYTLVG